MSWETALYKKDLDQNYPIRDSFTQGKNVGLHSANGNFQLHSEQLNVYCELKLSLSERQKMRFPLKTCALSILLLSGCSNQVVNTVVTGQNQAQKPAIPATSGIAARGADSGQKQKVWSYIDINPDCSSNDYKLKILTAPSHGKVTIEDSEDFPNYLKENLRSACNVKRVPSRTVYYTSEPEFTGADGFTIEVLSSVGIIRDDRFAMTVR